MLFIFVFISCVFNQPLAIVEVDRNNIEGIYIPAGYNGFIVAAPFSEHVF
jgi:hypothetical protein